MLLAPGAGAACSAGVSAERRAVADAPWNQPNAAIDATMHAAADRGRRLMKCLFIMVSFRVSDIGMTMANVLSEQQPLPVTVTAVGKRIATRVHRSLTSASSASPRWDV